MLDKEIAKMFMANILPAIEADPDMATVKLARNFQPRQHGANTGPYVYFVKIGDHKHGSPKRREVWNQTLSQFDHAEIQQYETTYQFSAWISQTPENTSSLTESDILNMVSGIIQSDTVMAAFRTAGAGILRVTEIRNPYIVDERDQFEAVPSFDVVLTHQRQRVATLPAVVTYEANVSRV